MQDETKNAERENESTHTLSEDIYSTQDSLLGGTFPFASIYKTGKLCPVVRRVIARFWDKHVIYAIKVNHR